MCRWEQGMATRRKAGSDLKVHQGKQRDAYFDRLRRAAQQRTASRRTTPVARPERAE